MNQNSNVVSWDDYFMGLAHLSAMRSKDPNTQVGACIVDAYRRVVSIGYNGLPHGCNDQDYPWQRDGEYLQTKYPYVVHAELNAILNAPRSVSGCDLYVSLFPCNECAKAIIQAGIKRVIYESDKYATTDQIKASKRMLASAGIALLQLDHQVKLDLHIIK